MRERITVHAAPRVGNGELDETPLRLHAHADAAALGREFERIGQKIEQQLAQRTGIHADDAAVAVGGKVERDAAEREKKFDLGTHAAAQADDIVVIKLEFFAVKKMSRVGQIADDAIHLIIALVKNGGAAVGPCVLLPHFGRNKPVDRRVERRH